MKSEARKRTVAITMVFAACLLAGCQTAPMRQSHFDVCRSLPYESPEWASCVQRAQVIDGQQRWQQSQAAFEAARIFGEMGRPQPIYVPPKIYVEPIYRRVR